MKLVDLISLIDDSTSVMVWAYNSDSSEEILVSMYDTEGEDSIDSKYNDCIIDRVSGTASGGIDIVLSLVVDEEDAISVDHFSRG